jgi:hypothetical protein
MILQKQSKQCNVKTSIKFNNSSMPKMTEMYEVSYQIPYNDCEWRSQYFNTKDEAERMVEFYKSCGSPAKLIERKVSN